MLKITKREDFKNKEEEIRKAIRKGDIFITNPNLIGRISKIYPPHRNKCAFFHSLQYLTIAEIIKPGGKFVQMRTNPHQLKAEIFIPVIEKPCKFRWIPGKEGDTYGRMKIQAPNSKTVSVSIEDLNKLFIIQNCFSYPKKTSNK